MTFEDYNIAILFIIYFNAKLEAMKRSMPQAAVYFLFFIVSLYRSLVLQVAACSRMSFTYEASGSPVSNHYTLASLLCNWFCTLSTLLRSNHGYKASAFGATCVRDTQCGYNQKTYQHDFQLHNIYSILLLFPKSIAFLDEYLLVQSTIHIGRTSGAAIQKSMTFHCLMRMQRVHEKIS